jgi:diguanylate cyclase (GGDEF)-like protein
VVRGDDELRAVLSAVAGTIAETLGYRAVVVNLYRPEWDDFVVTTVHDHDRSSIDLLVGTHAGWSSWQGLLDDRFKRGGAYFVPAGEYDWRDDMLAVVPDLPVSDDPAAWHPEDALFVPLVHTDGHLLGIISVDEPVSGLRPDDEELDVLVAVAEHAALALQSAQETAAAARHRLALEQLLQISSRLTETLSSDAVLEGVCQGIARALGFLRISIELPDPHTGLLTPRATLGWSLDELARRSPIGLEHLLPLLAVEHEVEGCYLLSHSRGQSLLPDQGDRCASTMNGHGPHAWNRHWLIVPLHGRDGQVIGVIWVDDPSDRLLPSAATMQALRVFANQATTALISAAQFEEVRFLAEHDALTRLLNRRAFSHRLALETTRSGRYRRPFALVLMDLDGFKVLNDRRGHQAGDAALGAVGDVLRGSMRSADLAFRTGGDEFALVLPETSVDEVRGAIERILSAFDRAPGPDMEGLSASFGVSVFPRDGRDPETLFRAADEAMYRAKRGGVRYHFAA